MVGELIRVFSERGYEIHGALAMEGVPPSPPVANRGFGSGRKHAPDVVGFDPEMHRVVFGLVRPDRKSLDTEDALEEYNVFLDHNEGLGDRASILLVQMPSSLVPEFLSMITHYVHREYWHRIVPVALPEAAEPAAS